MAINKYFDKVYVLNLRRRTEKLEKITNRLNTHNISFEVFNAIDGTLFNKVWTSLNNNYFSNPNYLATAISHLSIYKDAIDRGFNRILILEDDVRVNKNIQDIINNIQDGIPNWDLLYLGYIPLSDDCQMWDYSVFNDKYINKNVFISKNLWGLFSYGISKELMKNMIDIYNADFPMELDRYYVSNLQGKRLCFGISPQMFCVDDIESDNLGYNQNGMIQRSVDTRYATYEDFV